MSDDQKGSINSNGASNPELSVVNNEVEKATNTLSAHNGLTTHTISTTTGEMIGPNLSSGSSTQETTVASNISPDSEKFAGAKQETKASDLNELSEKDRVTATVSDEQTGGVAEADPTVNLNKVDENDAVSAGSSHPERKKPSGAHALTGSAGTETPGDSALSHEQEIQRGDSPSKQTNLKKVNKSKDPVDTKIFETSDISSISYNREESHLLESVFSTASDKKLIDRLFGCAYGQALGDAYGLSTEFEDRVDVAKKYSKDIKIIPFPDYILTGHNRRWERGDWTDDTDQWILILVTLVFHNGDEKVFAGKLSNWIRRGYAELGDHGGMGLGANVSQVVRSYNYINNPVKASEDVWIRGNRQAAPNGAVMRCSASAFVHFTDPKQVVSTAILMCQTTHFDPRCIASCVSVCLAIAYLLREEFSDDDIEALIKRVQKETIETLGDRFSKEDIYQFKYYTDVRTLEELNLDEEGKIGYTYKCLASGFYGLRSTRSFEETLNDLIRYGGDADTNGAVCGTMYGARYGYRKLPFKWLNAMPNKKWLDQILIKCLEKMNLTKDEAMETG